MNKNSNQKLQWLLIIGLPYLIIGVLTLGAGFLLLPFGAIVGVWVGLFATESYFTLSFKLGLCTALFSAIILALVGWRYRQKIGGKLLFSLAIYLWGFTGVFGFGPV